MATISNIANKIPCGGAAEANTGKLGCLSLFGTPTHMLALRKGTTILASDTFDIAYLKPLVQDGTIIPLINASAFEDVSGEDTYSTNTSGVKRLNLKGLPEYKLMFEEGHEFYRQLAKLEGYKNFDYIIGDEEGNWLLATKSDGNYQGFTAGHTTPELTKRKVAGGDAEMKSLLVQFTLRSQWDENYAILHQDELTFLPEEVPAINGVTLSFATTPAVGTAGSAFVDIATVLNSDGSSVVEGLTNVNDWYVTIQGVEDVVTLVTESPSGQYKLDLTSALASADVVTVDLYDQANSIDVADLTNVLYRSDTVTDSVP
jgi:hypothetical protein